MQIPLEPSPVPRAVDALIHRAIAERRLLRCVFQGHERIGEPHDYGIKNGRVELFLWQTGGTSRSGALPGWRVIHVVEAEDVAVLERRFPGRRETPTHQHRGWDELWARVRPRDAVDEPARPRREAVAREEAPRSRPR